MSFCRGVGFFFPFWIIGSLHFSRGAMWEWLHGKPRVLLFLGYFQDVSFSSALAGSYCSQLTVLWTPRNGHSVPFHLPYDSIDAHDVYLYIYSFFSLTTYSLLTLDTPTRVTLFTSFCTFVPNIHNEERKEIQQTADPEEKNMMIH